MSKKNKQEGEIEKTYQKKTQLEHILLRPDTYIGSVEPIKEKMWVIDEQKNTMQNKEITYVPGLYKIFDEILVNAVDNITRDTKMDTIKVEISETRISIYNNGRGIPIKMHNTYNLYVPELIFGHLLTSSNYNDNEKKITGGRNGFGAKLTNVFSKLFIVETADKKVKKKYKIEYFDNMSKHKDAEIEKYEGEDYTKITFEPDFEKFKMKKLDNDIISLLKKRVYDVAGTSPSRIKVFLNNSQIKIDNFKDYVDLYIKGKYFDEENKIEYPKLLANFNERWEVIFSMTDGIFQQVSFVNGICTIKGGTHVNYLIDQVVNRVSEHIKKKTKDIKLNVTQIKQNIWIFVNCKIENPAFDSQTKETLKTPVQNFGSECNLKDGFFKEFLKSQVVTNIIEFGKAKARVKLHKALTSNIKKSSRLLGIEKLEDANLAGTKDFRNCTLIVTEGDSAKSLAMAGVEIIGRDFYGCFPLRGKLLNVRGAKDNQIIKNEEIQNIIKILGLKIGMDYSDDLKGMRYGHLLIMTDQDYDGSHIKGLIINLIHFFWPSLIKRGDFLQEFITPIVKATKNGSPTLKFFTMKEYTDWFNTKNHTGYKIKYYKGLGTSTSNEAKEYFNEINKLRLNFQYVNNEDDKCIELAFSRVETEARKNWLRNFDPFNTFLDQSKGIIRYKNFINEEMIFFSFYDNIRSIPSLMDGLKPSERKILFACFKRNLKSEMKVAQLSGYVAEVSSYHHGEISLSQTITALAQDFVGSNNLNLLLPVGQFGTRYNGMKSAASPRYIYTNLNPITRKIFIEADDNLLLYNVDEGLKIEPIWYAPIIPMILVNGAEGIGTGWSTSIPNYNPIDLAENILCKIKNIKCKNLMPWYKGFSGDIYETFDNKGNKNYTVSGCININRETKCIEITELPVRTFIRDYKTFLEKNHVDNKENTAKREFNIEDIREYHLDNKISFVLKLTPESYNEIQYRNKDELMKIFKLTTTISTSNMVLFDSNNKIKKYSSVEEIVDEYYKVRLDFYNQRQKYLLAKLGFSLEKNKNKQKFVNLVLEGEIPFNKSKNKKEIFSLLKEKGLACLNELKNKYKEAFKIKSTEIVLNNIDNYDENNEENNIKVNKNLDFDYLMNMNIWSLTYEKVNELEKEIESETEEYEYLKSHKPEDLWQKDLEEFIRLYKEILKELDDKNNKSSTRMEQLKNSNSYNKGKIKGKTKTKEISAYEKKKEKIHLTLTSMITKINKQKEKDTFIVNDDEIDKMDFPEEKEFSDVSEKKEFSFSEKNEFDEEDQKSFSIYSDESSGPPRRKSKKENNESVKKQPKTKFNTKEFVSKTQPGSGFNKKIDNISIDEDEIEIVEEEKSIVIDDDDDDVEFVSKNISPKKVTKKNYVLKSSTNNKNTRRKNNGNKTPNKNEKLLEKIISETPSVQKIHNFDEKTKKGMANTLLKELGVLGKIDSSKSMAKLSIKERLALRAKEGKIDAFLNTMANNNANNKENIGEQNNSRVKNPVIKEVRKENNVAADELEKLINNEDNFLNKKTIIERKENEVNDSKIETRKKRRKLTESSDEFEGDFDIM